jgi:hypothetical protein
MATRAGEKFGWIGGWLGGFIWVVILSVIHLVQGRLIQGYLGLALFGLAVAVIVAGAPWRHPDTPYWQLMLPVYVVFSGSIVWLLWSSGGAKELGLNGWHVLVALPLLIPFQTVGRRRWNDFDA